MAEIRRRRRPEGEETKEEGGEIKIEIWTIGLYETGSESERLSPIFLFFF